MRISRGQVITGKKPIFKEERHCIHSAIVKTKQGSRVSMSALPIIYTEAEFSKRCTNRERELGLDRRETG
jgi:hypothetical protein